MVISGIYLTNYSRLVLIVVVCVCVVYDFLDSRPDIYISRVVVVVMVAIIMIMVRGGAAVAVVYRSTVKRAKFKREKNYINVYMDSSGACLGSRYYLFN